MHLTMILDMAVDGLGDRVAIGGRRSGLRYRQVRDQAAALARQIGEDGARTLAYVGPSSPWLPVALFGAAMAGVPYAPLNFRLPSDRTRQLLDALDRPMVIGPDTPPPGPVPGGAVDLTPPDDDVPAVLLYTSGTSSEPKAAVLSHDNLVSYLLNTVEFGSAAEDEALLLAVPPFHIAGVAAVLSATYAGRRIVPLPQFSAKAWLEVAVGEAVTHAFVVPTMLARIVAALDAGAPAPIGLRTLSYGGARMPLPVLERALAHLPNTGFVNAYGLTETSSTVAVLDPEDHRAALHSSDQRLRRRLSSVGRPVPGIEVRIEGGEILLRGEQVAGGYVGHGSRLDPDGWLRTGDVGELDEEGYLFVKGRADDLIIRAGENISPAQIEDALLSHPDVDGAVAVGVPDLEWGEVVAAAVTLRQGAHLEVDALRAWCRERIGSLMTPEALLVLPELPMTATGKVLRRDVRALLVDRS